MKYLIVGLGNPNKIYENTFHNIGKMVILKFAKHLNLSKFKINKKALSALTENKNIILAYPTIYMNESGKSIKNLLNFLKISPEKLIIIHDDNDLLMGKIKISFNKGAGGHKGVESIINNLKTKKFIRIRIGIQPQIIKSQQKQLDIKQNQSTQKIPAKKLVLKKINQKNKKLLEEIFKKIFLTIEIIVSEGLEKAMNKINQMI